MQKLFYMQTICYYYADNRKKLLFVLMILFDAETSTSFFSTARIGLSVTICQAQSINFLNVKDSGEIHAWTKGSKWLVQTEASDLAQPCQWISGFAFLLLVAGEKSRETKQRFFYEQVAPHRLLQGQDKYEYFLPK